MTLNEMLQCKLMSDSVFWSKLEYISEEIILGRQAHTAVTF